MALEAFAVIVTSYILGAVVPLWIVLVKILSCKSRLAIFVSSSFSQEDSDRELALDRLPNLIRIAKIGSKLLTESAFLAKPTGRHAVRVTPAVTVTNFVGL